MELPAFSVAGGSVPGTDHTKPGKPGWTNNQDAYAWYNTPHALVAVVCDGCGSMPKSDVGAQLVAPLIAKHLAVVAKDLDSASALRILERWVYSFVEHTARVIGNDVVTTVGDYFLFTVLGVLVTPERTVIFEAGDGLYAINGEAPTKLSYPDNAPPYLGHRTTGWYPKDKIGIRIRAQLPTANVESILIGTDGVADAIAAETACLPGNLQREAFGPLRQFVEDDLYVRNPDAIRRRLALANRETVERGIIKRGLLPDDTTLVVVRRIAEGGSNA